ncbi:hypothetical protein WJX82_007103 [Trebouxia sp. C0006]
MAFTRYLGWILLPILVWSIGGAWIEGFTKSHFQQDIVMDTTKLSTVRKSDTDSLVTTPLLSPPPPADLFAAVNSNPIHQYKNNLNSTHYMLYHEEQPTQQKYEPYTYGFLTTMARIEGKMKRKKPMAVTFIGGSVTAAYCKEPGIGCWVTPVSEWLMEENPQIQIGNSAIGGITSSTAAQCFDAMVNPTSDLVLIEFSLNDRFISPQQQIEGFEQLLRRLLKLPHQPAVVVVHWWSPVHDCSKSQQLPDSNKLALGTMPCMQRLWNTTEDHIQRLVEHYNVHSLSFRNKYWSAIDAEEEGFTPDKLFMRDEIHPSGRGASQCSRGGALQDMALYNYGWKWLDGKKPGFQTDEVLTSLFLSVPVESSTSDRISVGYLSSYENMGIARITCLGACQCEEFDIDASSTAHASQEHNALIPFQHSGDAKGCILKVDNMNLTNAVNEGHRFKVSSVTVADREAARVTL